MIKTQKKMKTKKFKTNAKCNGCITKIAEKLNQITTKEQWNINLSDPEKTLTITTDQPDEKIIETIRSAGFEAQPKK